MSVDLTGRIALVTGASRGIGAAVAKAYARAGAHVIITGRTVGGLEAVDDEIRKEGGQATLIPLDLLGLDDLDKLGPTIYERFGQLDIFVANAGLLGTLGPLSHANPNEWTRVMDTNVNANFRLIRTLDPILRASDAGRAMFVTSGVTQGPRAYWGSYTVSKVALEALALTYAAETENTAMRVNIVDPGRVRTSMRAAAYPGEDPLMRPAPEEIVETFLDLASPSCQQHGQRVDVTVRAKAA